MLCGALRSAGIDAKVFDQQGQLSWGMQIALGGFRVAAPTADVETARAFLGASLPSEDYESIPKKPIRGFIKWSFVVLGFLTGA